MELINSRVQQFNTSRVIVAPGGFKLQEPVQGKDQNCSRRNFKLL
jgi:hypothetical protein